VVVIGMPAACQYHASIMPVACQADYRENLAAVG
jgi:hypothetical protein